MRIIRRRTQARIPSAPGLPPVQGPVNDNTYLAAATQAAVTDVSSGAYDEFLFEDDALIQMPFESALDSHTELLSLRLSERERREVLAHTKEGIKARAKFDKADRRLSESRLEQANCAEDIEYELRVLAGEIPGKNNVYWPGPIPQLTSKFAVRVKLSIPFLLYTFVAFADIAIFVVSLGSIFKHDGWKIAFFAAPAIGIQVGFPHIVGERIALILRGHSKKVSNYIQVGLLGGLWLLFCYALAQIRIEYVKQADHHLKSNVAAVIFLMTLLMVIGLGSLLIFLAIHANPHEHTYLKLLLRQKRLAEKLRKYEARQIEAKAILDAAELQLATVIEIFAKATSESGLALAEAAKGVYRRALINQMSSADFTSSFLKVKQNQADKDGTIE